MVLKKCLNGFLIQVNAHFNRSSSWTFCSSKFSVYGNLNNCQGQFWSGGLQNRLQNQNSQAWETVNGNSVIIKSFSIISSFWHFCHRCSFSWTTIVILIFYNKSDSRQNEIDLILCLLTGKNYIDGTAVELCTYGKTFELVRGGRSIVFK